MRAPLASLALAVLAAALAAAVPASAPASKDLRGTQCGLPTKKPLWLDFGTPPLAATFARRGVVLAVSSGDFPAQLRAQGAQTVYWDMHLNKRVGTPVAPQPAELMVEKANRLFDYAAAQTGCPTPWIALNELFGASLETPWSVTNTQYRENVLTFVRTLAGRGARPFLLLSSNPYTGSEAAAAWWREAGRYADLVPEVYFPAPAIYKAGPILGNRRMRMAMRRAVTSLTSIGISRDRIGIVLGFQVGRGIGGREGLQPPQAWFRVVKWQALSARQVAKELGFSTIWSWGWGSYREDPGNKDKPAAACVYLWTRDARLCDGPRAAGRGFDASLTEGQLVLPRGVQCAVGRRTVPSTAVAALARVTGDRDVALSILLARLAEGPYAPVTARQVLAAERAVISTRFGGRRAAYGAALARAGATVSLARSALGDELRRIRIELRLPARRPSATEVTAFYDAYPELRARRVEAKPAPWWLGGRTAGWALEPLAPPRVFAVATGARARVQGLDRTYTIRATGETHALGALPLAQARPAIATALSTFARRAAYDQWSVARQTGTLWSATCLRDDLPSPGTIRVSSYLPFLAL